MVWRWAIGTIVLAGCGPVVGPSNGSADGSSANEASDSTGLQDAGNSTDAESSMATEVTGSPAERRCLDWVPIDIVDDVYYYGAVRLQPGALQRLLFVEIDGDVAATHVAGADMLAGPWTTLDVLPGVQPRDIGDVDGDGLDDVIMYGTDSRWWGPDATGTLSDRGQIIDDAEFDALFRFPGDAKAGRAHASGVIAIARGHGDGTFAESVFTEPPSPDA